jgi:hypothetical protein
VRRLAKEGLAGQALADKLLGVHVGMTGKALTSLVGRPAVARNVAAAAMGGSGAVAVAVAEEAPEQERWVFETDFGYFLVLVQQGQVAEVLTGGLLDRLRPAWRTQSAQ